MSGIIINPYLFGSAFSSTKSLAFDGVDDYVDLGSPSTGTGTHTLSMWINPATITNDDRIISNINNTNFSIRFTASNVEVWGNSWESVFANPSTSTWTHICFMFDGSGNVTGYKDGVVGSTVATVYNFSNLGIGARAGLAHGDEFHGNIDEVSIFNSVKAIGDIWDGTGKPTDLTGESGLVGYWKMGEDATFVYNVNPDGTWTIPDQAGSNDGTSNNLMADSARVGTAPSSSNNAVSFNMDAADIDTETPPNP